MEKTYLWGEGLVLVQLVGVLDRLVVALLQDVFEQPRRRSLEQLTLDRRSFPLQQQPTINSLTFRALGCASGDICVLVRVQGVL